ncbi:MAG: leucine-rich repeat domain-containing protein [Prevotellaceae bacterium]|nr:leucine-rich repeat domain-containing protein [Prevotellaceae bacterium]
MKKTTLLLAMCLISTASFAATGGAVNENINWALDDDGTLTISGTGDMPDYGHYASAPWYNHRYSIESVMVEYGITKIGKENFHYDYTALVSVSIPNSVITIGEMAFSQCDKLTEIIIPNSVTSIGKSAFSSSGIQKVTIPNSIITIGDMAFSGCASLQEIVIPNSVISIGEWAFEGCYVLTKVVLSNSIEDIGYYTFANCDDIKLIIVNWETPYVLGDYFALWGKLNKAQCTLIVPAGTKSLYQQAEVWKDFIIIEQINIEITPESIFSWQPTEDATGYQLIIYSDEAHTEIVRILNFDNEGNYIPEQQPAKSLFATLAENTNYSYQITNLSPSTTYYYSLTAYQNETEIAQQQGSFTTTGTDTGINDVETLPAASVAGYYNILGTKLPKEPASGVYIILYDNGKVEKVIK